MIDASLLFEQLFNGLQYGILLFLLAAGLTLVLGGALGNLVDRIMRGPGWLDGHVVDWIALPNFPTFNIADSAITVGAVFLVLGAWRNRSET